TPRARWRAAWHWPPANDSRKSLMARRDARGVGKVAQLRVDTGSADPRGQRCYRQDVLEELASGRSSGPGSAALQHLARIAGLHVDRHDGRLGEEIELRGARPGVGTHGPPDDQVARLQLREHEVLCDDVDAVTGRTGEHGRQSLDALAERLDGVARVVVELAAVGPVQTVVQVVPPVAFAARAPHDRGNADRGRPDDVATR